MSLNIFEATQRVSKIAEQKYGCTIQFVYFQDGKFETSDADTKESLKKVFETIARNYGSQFIISQGSLLVPVYVDSELFGTIIVKEGIHLDPGLFEDLHNFLDITLKDFIVKKEKLRRIRIEESILKAQKQENVVPLFKSPNLIAVNDFTNDSIVENSMWRGALFLTGGDYSQTRTIALEIHSLLNRGSFVPYSVLEFQNPQFSQSLPDLGKITIFIPEIVDLSEKESLEIVKYVQERAHKHTPFIILSSQKTLKELEKENILSSELLKCLKEFHLEFATTSNLKSFYNLILPQSDSLEH